MDEVRRALGAAPKLSSQVAPQAPTPAEGASVPKFAAGEENAGEERSRGWLFAVAAVLVLAVLGYGWYRYHEHSVPAVPQSQVAATTPAQAPAPAAQEAQPAPSQTANAGSETPQPTVREPEAAGSENEKPVAAVSKPVVHANTKGKKESDAEAEDTTRELAPAALTVAPGRKKAQTAAEMPVAPPSLDAVSGGQPSDSGMVGSVPVALPKMLTPKRIRVSQGVTEGMLVRQVRPTYPPLARQSRMEGDVVLDAVIAKDGAVRELKVLSGPAMLAQSAVQAVRQWRYQPYLLDGQPVEVETLIKVQFRL
jgi:TonB family protein